MKPSVIGFLAACGVLMLASGAGIAALLIERVVRRRRTSPPPTPVVPVVDDPTREIPHFVVTDAALPYTRWADWGDSKHAMYQGGHRCR